MAPARPTRASGARGSSSRSRGWKCCEGRPLLRRARHADARGVRARPQADGPGRQPADPVARDEVLRALRAHRLRAVPGLQGRGHQALLPDLQRGARQRLRAQRGRGEGPSAQDRHPQLEHHVRGHRPALLDRRAAARGAAPAARRRDVPRQLRRHGHRRRPAGDGRSRQGDRRDRQLPRRPAELQLPRRVDRTTTAASTASAT